MIIKKSLFLSLSFIFLLFVNCSTIINFRLKPDNVNPQKVITLSNETLTTVFVDNSAFGENHKAGYNGIAELKHISVDSSIFVPFYAGFNLEHIFGGDSLQQKFEPRKHPMELYQLSSKEVVLYQSPTPLSKVESTTHFKLVDPHYIDVTFRFIIHDKKFFKHDYAGLFWASYINAPSDKNIYFWGRKKGTNKFNWISAYSKKHGEKSTHLNEKNQNEIYFAPNFDATLASNFSDYFFEYPFYFGRFHNMALAYMFHPAEGIRFSQSPTGGGSLNPAWDFQYIVPDFQMGREYSFKARIIYKPFKDNKDILTEYLNWTNS